MEVEYYHGVKTDIDEEDVTLFWEWHTQIGIDDGYDGQSYLAAFALGYDLAMRALMTQLKMDRIGEGKIARC